jgi:predicted RNase H-like nuclease
MTRPSVGIDGYSGGWVAVALAGDGAFVRAWPGPSLAELLAGVPVDTGVGIDIPLGGVAAGWRHADEQGRLLLGSRRSTLFRVPPRPLWDLPYADANVEHRRLTNGGLPKQTWNLFRKMMEAEEYDAGAHSLREVHPELVFAAMAGVPIASKRSWAGQMRRRALLGGVGVVLPDDLGSAGAVAPDDVLDAAAVAWCAHRFDAGARHVPESPDQYDGRGRPIVIWY